MNLMLILLVVIIAGLILIKFTDLKHRFKFITVTVILIFLAITAGYVYLTNDLDLSNFQGWLGAGKVYFNWLTHVTGNIVKISGYAVQQDWTANTTTTLSG